ncbi:MAG: M18 family aminopeptidase [Johnsonella sp.]|nr:M18 family aminopeptidase [Johnsonella sp.]
MRIEENLFDFIEQSPTSAHAVSNIRKVLEERGFIEISEGEASGLIPGQSYFILHGSSSLAAFKLPRKKIEGFSIVAPHGDSPCFKLKASPEIKIEKNYTKLNAEIYGGTPHMLWLDRPLSVAGKLALRTDKGVLIQLTDIRRELMMIPSLAIHLNREINQGMKLDPQKELLPLFGSEEADILAMAAEAAGVKKEDILSHELYLYSRSRGKLFGADEEFIAAPRLDDLACVFCAFTAFCEAENTDRCIMLTVFDSEEIGSMTRQGADSTFLRELLFRIGKSSGLSSTQINALLAGSFLVSADNAHAKHPNYPEKSDPTNPVYLNRGIALKYGPRYATDALSAGVFSYICKKSEIPLQSFYNHSAIPGGSTLGNISGSQISLPTVDIGIPQLGMHSPCETAGKLDILHMIRALQSFYQTKIRYRGDGSFDLF